MLFYASSFMLPWETSIKLSHDQRLIRRILVCSVMVESLIHFSSDIFLYVFLTNITSRLLHFCSCIDRFIVKKLSWHLFAGPHLDPSLACSLVVAQTHSQQLENKMYKKTFSSLIINEIRPTFTNLYKTYWRFEKYGYCENINMHFEQFHKFRMGSTATTFKISKKSSKICI